jgi:hypothetical protein
VRSPGLSLAWSRGGDECCSSGLLISWSKRGGEHYIRSPDLLAGVAAEQSPLLLLRLLTSV